MTCCSIKIWYWLVYIKIDYHLQFKKGLAKQRRRKKIAPCFRVQVHNSVRSSRTTLFQRVVWMQREEQSEKLVEISRGTVRNMFFSLQGPWNPPPARDGNDIWILEPLDGRFSPRWIAVCQRCLPKYHSIRPPLHNVTASRTVLLDVQYSTLRLHRVFYLKRFPHLSFRAPFVGISRNKDSYIRS